LRALIIGMGSIGMRHLQVLQKMGIAVEAVSRHGCKNDTMTYPTINDALHRSFDYIVVANETEKHYDAFNELVQADFDGKLLIEKPVFDEIYDIPAHRFSEIYVGFNLRFHPLIRRMREILLGEKIISASFYTGQYLPLWRSNRHYSDSYSARSLKGGGVLKDLSHEIDMVHHFFGEFVSLAANGGQFSALDIVTPDVYSMVAACKKCPSLTWQVNYLDRLGRRQYIINTDQHTYCLDLVGGNLTIDDVCEHVEISRDDTYALMHEQVMNGNKDNILCDLKSGQYVLKVIKAAEKSNQM